MINFEDLPKALSTRYTVGILRAIIHILNLHRTQWILLSDLLPAGLSRNNRVNETSGNPIQRKHLCLLSALSWLVVKSRRLFLCYRNFNTRHLTAYSHHAHNERHYVIEVAEQIL